jgi:hypothetical protein
MSCRQVLWRLSSWLAAETPVALPAFVAGSACCQVRFKAKKRLTHREDDLIQEALDDAFGADNAYSSARRQMSIVDGRSAHL